MLTVNRGQAPGGNGKVHPPMLHKGEQFSVTPSYTSLLNGIHIGIHWGLRLNCPLYACARSDGNCRGPTQEI